MPTVFKVADAVVAFRAEMSQLNRDLGSVQKTVKASMGNILQAGQMVGQGFTIVGGAIVGALGLGVKAAAESEQAQAQLAAVLKSTGGAAGMTAESVNQLATELSRTTTFEDDVIVSGQSMLLTFTNVGRDVFPAATMAMLDMSTALGQDVQSSAVQLGKALNDPINGITALRRVGVSFTEEQRAVIEAMVETGDVAGAQKLILAELATEFGGSATAQAQTFTGQLLQLKNEFGNLLEEIGNALTGGGGIRGLIEAIRDAVMGVTDWIKANPELASTLVWVAGAVGGIMVVVGPLLMALPGLVTLFGIVGTVIGAISAPVAIAVAAIAALIGVGVALYANWEEVTAFAGEMWEGIKDFFSGGLEFIGRVVQFNLEMVKGFFVGAAEAIWSIWEGLLSFLAGAWDWLVGFFWGIIDGVKAALSWIWDLVKALGNLLGLGASGEAIQQATENAVAPHALGGVVRTPLQIVGERGPELAALPLGTRIYTAGQTRSMLGAGGIGSQTVNINLGGVVVNNEADEERLARKIGENVQRALRGRGVRLNTARATA